MLPLWYSLIILNPGAADTMLKLKRLCTLALLLLALNAESSQRRIHDTPDKVDIIPDQLYTNSWALLVGTNIYSSLSDQYQLRYAVNDVEELRKLLLDKYQFLDSNIITLKNRQATCQNIRQKLGELSNPDKVSSNDRALVFFSGHGQTVSLPRGGEMGFIIPYDAEVEMDNVKNPSAYYSTCLPMDELKRLAAMIPAKHVLFLIDACYSGLVFGSRGGEGRLQPSIPGYLRKVASVPVQQVITAGMRGDKSSERSEWGHGAFTYKLLEALRTGVADENEDGVMTGLELATHLRNVVPRISPTQTPHYGYFQGEGEFLFLWREASQPQPVPAPSPIYPKSIDGGDNIRMMLVPAGDFEMGSNDGADDEKPIHTVYVDAFYMDIFEVTNRLYAKFLNQYGENADGDGNALVDFSSGFALIEKIGDKYAPKAGYEDHPVVMVTWYGANEYAKCYGKRLPTEAEWEKAARGGLTRNRYPWGNKLTHDDANYLGMGGKDIWMETSPVGSFAPNGYGLYDMVGNVREWCKDWYDSGYYIKSPRENPTGPSFGMERACRGGSWFDNVSSTKPVSFAVTLPTFVSLLRVSDRFKFSPTTTDSYIGLRCVQDAAP